MIKHAEKERKFTTKIKIISSLSAQKNSAITNTFLFKMIGWVPVEKSNKQHCWHSSVVDYELGTALVLKQHPDDPGLLEVSAVPLSGLLEQTLELIGTNINGNPYGE